MLCSSGVASAQRHRLLAAPAMPPALNTAHNAQPQTCPQPSTNVHPPPRFAGRPRRHGARQPGRRPNGGMRTAGRSRPQLTAPAGTAGGGGSGGGARRGVARLNFRPPHNGNCRTQKTVPKRMPKRPPHWLAAPVLSPYPLPLLVGFCFTVCAFACDMCTGWVWLLSSGNTQNIATRGKESGWHRKSDQGGTGAGAGSS